MDKLMKKLLNDLDLDDYMDSFTNTKIINNKFKNNDELEIKINCVTYLDPKLMDTFIMKTKQFFKEFNLKIVFNVEEELSFNIIDSYLRYFSKRLDFSKQVLNILENRDIAYDISTNEVRINVYNNYEFESVDSAVHRLEKLLNLCGIDAFFGCVEVTHEIDLDSQLKEIVENAAVQESVVEEVKIVKSNNSLLYGKKIGRVTHTINNLETNMNNVCIEGEVFSVDTFKTKNNKYIVTIMMTDYSDSITAKIFLDEKAKEVNDILSLNGKYIKLQGHVTYDMYAKGDVIRTTAISLEQKNSVLDNAEEKRVELHIHTNMSAVDSVVDASQLIKYANTNGYEAIGVVDHNSVQSFPNLYNQTRNTDLKVIYGAELNVVDDSVNIIFNNFDGKTLQYDDTYVVFDFETTGLNPFENDKIIEVGAVKVKNGEVIDSFGKLCNPGVKISDKITEITGIKNSMLINQPSEEEVVTEFKDWIEDLPLVAQNAMFDYEFLLSSYMRFDLGTVNNPIIDTLELSRVLHPEWGRHGLAALVKRYKIKLENHHRALDDATATAAVFHNQLLEAKEKELEYVSDLNSLVDTTDVFKFGKIFHLTVFVKNNVGLKNLFKLISLANTTYFYKEPRLLKSVIDSHREGLIIGSSCVNGEIFSEAKKKNNTKLLELMKFYDVIEVQPPKVYNHLVQVGEFESLTGVAHIIKNIIECAKKLDKPVIATGDVHHLLKRDKILREIIINNPAPGGGFHKLKNKQIESIPSQHFRTTKEMLDEFSFLGDDTAYEIVMKNPKELISNFGEVEVIKDKLFTPKMPNSDVETRKMVMDKAHSIYGKPLPQIVSQRIERELNGIIENGYDVIYLISSKLVVKSLENGYLVGSRGSVGSSLVATMMDITEVNPLPPHYICPSCQYSKFIEDDSYGCGYDLPKESCPNCETELIGEGHDIPFETFLGFKGDKVPDIDLNFSGEYQAHAHDYTKVLFGEEFVYRAGTISTIAEKTAFGYVKGYEDDKSLSLNNAELTRLSSGCKGVKRGTGQHPGGIIVVPDDMDIYDFTPIQYPADDTSSNWKTTHFDFNAIHDNLLKLDILGHDDPTMLHMLNAISEIDSTNVEFAHQKVVNIFSSSASLGIEPYQIKLNNGNIYTLFSTGTLGVPEFGTRFVIEMLRDTKPATFAELVKISGLSHGTDVWLNNAQYLIRNNICEFKEIIGCRDDIMVYLMHKNLEPQLAFKIMEDVRKGKGLTEEYIRAMKEKDVPTWYIESCQKIKYMFPKAHATAYVLMAMRIAYFKVFHPLYFYATFFSIRCSDFDIQTMIKGEEAIIERITEILNKEFDATPKEKNVLGTLEIALEMVKRGFSFKNVCIDQSDATKFIVMGDSLLPPFSSIDGLGDNVARNIIDKRSENPFMSIEDLKKRGKVNKTILTKLEIMGVTDHLPESDQLTLF